MTNRYSIYILTNDWNTVLYVGVTKDLEKRIYEHKYGISNSSFTAKYNLHKLVYFEEAKDINDAIAREKQIKGWKRAKKISLIEKSNPDWRDLIGDKKD